MSIASEITRINNNIANAYTQCSNKGATMPATQNSANLANTISTISGGGGVDINDYFNTTIDSVSTSSNYFGQSFLKKIPTLTIASGITSLEYAFYDYPLEDLVFEGIDCSNITSISAMFYCYRTANAKAKKIDVSNWTNTQNITNFYYAFFQNASLEYLIGSKNLFATDKQVNCSYCFTNCQSLKHLDLSDFNPASSSTGIQMFRYTYKLATLDVSNIDFNKISISNMFGDCGRDCLQSDGAYADGIPYVYVKDATQQSKVLNTSGNGKPASWTTNNVVIKSS